MPFSDFYLIFKLIFYEFFLFKNRKKGFTNLQADVARGTASRCDAHWGHVAEPRWPARGVGGADAWQEATQTGPRGRPCGAPRGRQVGGGPTGIVGPW